MKDEIIIYQANEQSTRLEVRIEEDTVWLTQAQMVELFNSTKQNVSLHINNIFKDNELIENSVVKFSLTTASDGKKYKTKFYNLDVIISIGYRVKSQRGTQFRIWANKVLKEYLLKGYAVNQRFERIEKDVHYLKEKVEDFDIQIKTNLPPNEGVFFDGQVFDAYLFVSKKHNTQYPEIDINIFTKSHDRFLIIDQQTVYHIGASLKDLGKKWFAFSKITLDPTEIISRLK